MTLTATTADRLEARARKAMAELAQHPARGWDSEQDRLPVLEALDQVLDAFNAEVAGHEPPRVQ